MKKHLLIILLCFNYFLNAQYTQIPDFCFESILIETGIDSEGILDGQVRTSDVVNVVSLDLGYFGFSCHVFDTSGIEDFINLEFLFIGNSINTINLSNNLQLKEITALQGSLQDINIVNCAELTYLVIIDNHLTSIDLSTNINLEYLDLNSNSLSSIDLSNNLNLSKFYVAENQLTELNINNLINLEIFGCNNNLITDLNISDLNNLTNFYAYSNFIENISLSNLPNLKGFGLSNNNITQIDISNYNLKTVNLKNNQLEFLDVRNDYNQNIAYFNTMNNPSLTCIYVDNIQYSNENWLLIDNTSTFVETETACEALAINETVVNEFNIFPNPVKNILHLETANIPIKEIRIFNTLGQEIINTNNTSINLSSFNSGIFFVKIKTEKDEIITKKIIKK